VLVYAAVAVWTVCLLCRAFAARWPQRASQAWRAVLGASLLAAAILPIATSYVVAESLGYEKGIGRRREEAPVFVGVITAMIAISAIVAVIPGVPVISLLIGVQVVNGVLLPINLYFIWQLSRSRRVMGEQRSRGVLDAATGLTVVVLSCLSVVLVAVTIFGV